MYVLKIFHEEPAALGATFDGGDSVEAFLGALGAAPRHHRLYLTGSVAPEEGHAAATGLTALPSAAWQPALEGVLGAPLGGLAAGTWTVLPGPSGADARLHAALAVSDAPTRNAALRSLLDAGGTVFHAEPAPDGYDVHVFAPRPLLAPFLAALPPPSNGVRRYAAPYRSLRSEAKFYFERWGALPPPAGVVEV